jgi:hypothetical protein
MAALFLLLAIVGGSEGLLLAMVAAFGVVVGLLVVASAGTTRTRRARRKRLRTAGSDLSKQVAELQRENRRLRVELARRDQRVRHLGKLAGPAGLGSTHWAGSTVDHRVTVPSTRWRRSATPSPSTRVQAGCPAPWRPGPLVPFHR